ncbi:hypothetical protein [Chelatococcus asaccharovorans]|uniref:Uncharacterized protein n=1 Tax=Chelatococcus asaccharovorans TaxID=28210 RepID=A0A2V3U394_9HYPH|nr:hypothetical protein [Chelatococcus asaccharovorans]MBS7702715.1 hypothetical protein [Chelatococcus asaccharovorans]PXW57007.1 hypothetical protein C7450_10744 [Chelatococcus asaccharovorans]
MASLSLPQPLRRDRPVTPEGQPSLFGGKCGLNRCQANASAGSILEK